MNSERHSVYHRILRCRKDMSEWLVHFTRDQPLKEARKVLLKILTEGALRPGFAPRGNPPRATVYGQTPVVCFTEQPIASLIDYIRVRGDFYSISGYGILIHKHDVYVAGGLPVVYGLCNAIEDETAPITAGASARPRMLKTDCLPLDEQFRYVAFAPTRSPDPIDWTHEREWRWPANSHHPLGKDFFYLGGFYINPRMGSFEGRVHAFVRHHDDIEWLRVEIRKAVEKDLVGKLPWRGNYTETWLSHLRKIDVIVLDTGERYLKDGNAAFCRLEDWPSNERHKLFE